MNYYRSKVLSLHDNTRNTTESETPHFRNSAQRSVTQPDDFEVKGILPAINSKQKYIPEPSQKNKFKLKGVQRALFPMDTQIRLPQINQSIPIKRRQQNMSLIIDINKDPIYYSSKRMISRTIDIDY